MKNKISLLILTFVFVLSLFNVAYASSDTLIIDYSNDEVTLKTTLEGLKSGVEIMFFDLNPSYDKDDITNIDITSYGEVIAHTDQLVTATDGKIEYSYTPGFFAKGGEHKVVLVRPDNGEMVELDSTYIFYDENDKLSIIDDINSAASSAIIEDILDEYNVILAIEDYDEDNITSISKTIYKQKEISKLESKQDLHNAYKLGETIVKLNQAATFDAYIEVLNDDGLYTWFTSLKAYSYFSDDLGETLLNAIKDKLLSLNAEHTKDIETLFTEEVIFAKVKSAKNHTYIQGVVDNNISFMKGLNLANYNKLRTSVGTDSVFNDIKGRTYTSISVLTNDINTLVNKYLNKASGNKDTSTPSKPSGFGSVAGDVTKEDITKPIVNFTDMLTVPWAQEAVGNLASLGVVNGKGTNSFCPNDLITREEFVKIVVEAFGLYQTSDINFSDVSADSWSYEYVKRGYGSGIIKGTDDNSFGAKDYITREDISVILVRILEKTNVLSQNEVSFNDALEISDYAKDAVKKLSSQGIINGFSDNTFRPKHNATRAEACVMIWRTLGR